MYIKNRRNSSKFKACGSYQTLCLTESFVLRNRLLFIYEPLWASLRNDTTECHRQEKHQILANLDSYFV